MGTRSNHRFHAFVVAFAVAMTFSVTSTLMFDMAWGEKRHPGRVLKDEDKRPLKADVEAWAAGRRGEDKNNCPQYQEILDTTESDAHDGEFFVKIADDEEMYNTVYCETGYHAKTYTNIVNREDGDGVVPYNVFLIKQSTTAEEREIESIRIRSRVINLTSYLLNELANLREVNPDAVESAFHEYGKMISRIDDRGSELLSELHELVSVWSDLQ